MNILSGLFILAARDGGRDFSWVVPVVFVVIWIISGVGKVIAAARQDRKQREKQRSAGGQREAKMRYKPIPGSSAPEPQRRDRSMSQTAPIERVRDKKPAYDHVRDEMPDAEQFNREPKHQGTIASLKKAMHDAMEEAQMQKAKRVAIKAEATRRPKKVQRKTTRKVPAAPKPMAKEPVMEVEVLPQEGSVLRELLEKDNIRKAIIYSEILGKPLAMRES
ncbi:MAG: hypothetical protein K9M75_07030 [Phycisphaerae bacterium]|nr:hypothetical protein [Phycisphaerae bacterium]